MKVSIKSNLWAVVTVILAVASYVFSFRWASRSRRKKWGDYGQG